MLEHTDLTHSFLSCTCGPLFFVQETSDGRHDWFKRSSASGSFHHAREKAQVALELKRGKEVFCEPLHVSESFHYTPTAHPKSEEDENFLKQTLKSFILFQELSDEEIQTMIDATERQEMPKDTTLVKQDANAQNLQIIQKGKVDVYCERSQKSVGTLAKGEIFGEMALLYGENAPHSFVIVDDPTIVWRLDHHTFRRILAHSAHKRDSNILSRLANIPMFQSLSELSLQKFANSLTRVTFEKEESIVTKGDVGTVFYLIEDGEVLVHDIGIGDGKAVDQYLQAGGKILNYIAFYSSIIRCCIVLRFSIFPLCTIHRFLWGKSIIDWRASCRKRDSPIECRSVISYGS